MITTTKNISIAVNYVEGGCPVTFETPGYTHVMARLSEVEEDAVDIAICQDDEIEQSYFFDAADLRRVAKLFKRLADMLDERAS